MNYMNDLSIMHLEYYCGLMDISMLIKIITAKMAT